MTDTTASEFTLNDPRIVPTENGFRLQETDEYVVEAWKMMFNWRLIVMKPNQTLTVEHGYCYFGTDLATLAKTVAIGLTWEDPLNSPPEGYDKQAF
jgi:hypothetical protein